MSTALRLAWHDLWRCRALWLLWILVLVLRTVHAELGPSWAFDADVSPGEFAIVGTTGMFVEFALFWLIAAIVVQADSVVDPGAFWRSRPIGRGAMWGAKLLVLVAVLVMVPVLIDAGRLLWRDASAHALAAAATQTGLTRGAWLTAAWWLASITPSLAIYVIVMATSGLALAVSTIGGIPVIAVIAGRALGSRRFEPPVPDHTLAYVGTGVCVAGGALLMWRYYRRGRRAELALGALGILAATLALGRTGVPPMMSAHEPAPPSWVLDPDVSPIAFGQGRVNMGPPFRMPPSFEPHVLVWGEVRLIRPEGPSGHRTQLVVSRSQIVAAGNARFEGVGGVSGDGNNRDARFYRWHAALPDAAREPHVPAQGFDRFDVALATLPAAAADAIWAGPVRVEASGELRVTRTAVVASTPLGEGVLFAGTDYRVELLRVRSYGPGLQLLVRHVRYPALRPGIVPEVSLRLRERREAEPWTIVAPQRELAWDGLPGFTHQIGPFLGRLGSPWGSQWTVVWLATVPGPDAITSTDVGVPPGAWVDVVESRYAGRAARTWSGDGLLVHRVGVMQAGR